jgi:tetratricopeptide (TPR) repeat protein
MSEQIVGATPMQQEEKKSKGVYTQGAILVGAILGGPVVVGWLMGENYKALEKKKLSIRSKVIGVVSFVGIIILGSFAGKSNLRLGTIVDAAAYSLFFRFQKKDVEDYIKNGGKKRRFWPAICIVFAVILYGLLALSLFGNNIANYYTESKGISASTIDTNKQAMALAKAHDFSGAIKVFDQSIAIDSQDSLAYLMRGISKLGQNDPDGAIADFGLALTNKHNDLHDRSAYFFRGQVYYHEQKRPEAIADFTKALAVKDDPILTDSFSVADIYFLRGVNHQDLGEGATAIADFNSVIEVNPQYPNVKILLANTELMIGNVQDACSRALQMGEPVSSPYLNQEVMQHAVTNIKGYCASLK